jgi:hypothetical protein
MLRAGTDTGSLMNHLQSRMTKGQPKAEVGMGATLLGWTDRYAATIVAVEGDGLSAGTIITVQNDRARVVSGSTMDGSAEYEYERNPNAPTRLFRLSRKGFWEGVFRNPETGRWNKSGNGVCRIGGRQEYRDPHF